MPWPTPYPDVNAAVLAHFAGLRRVLGPRMIGLYLHGSLALGDFDPASSDVDLMIVTDGELTDAELAELRAMHAAFDAGGSPWAGEVEAYYLPLSAVRRHDPSRAVFPKLNRGGEELALVPYDRAWVIQLHVLREHGLRVEGPPLVDLVDPVGPDELRQAAAALAADWLSQVLQVPAARLHRGYQVFIVLSVCRILHTVETGTVGSKPVAARWAQAAVEPRWTGLIERALAWRKRDQPTIADEEIAETLDFIRYALAELA